MVHQNGAPDITNAVGQRQLLGTLAHIASTSPHKTYLSLARSSRIEDGFEDLSYGRFNQAVDRAAFWLERHFGRSPDLSVVRPVFASLPRHDLRGGLLIAAAPKAGLHMYWAQPFGDKTDILEALRELRCGMCIKPDPCHEVVEEVLDEYGSKMKIVPFPPLAEWLRDEYVPDAPSYPYDAGLSKTKELPWCIFQTSGTTGAPKPVVLRHGLPPAIDNHELLTVPGEREVLATYLKGKRVLSSFGWYQIAGLLFSMIMPVYFDFVCVMAPDISDWNGELVDAAHVHGNVQASLIYPALMVEVAKDEKKLKNLERLDIVFSGGSSIPLWVGDKAAERTEVTQIFGSTEGGLYPLEIPRTRDEWSWMRLRPELGWVLRPYLGKFHHLIFLRQEQYLKWQGVFANYLDQNEFETGDLMERHPTKPDLIRPAGRIVDLLRLPNGHILNPIPIEARLGSHPDIDIAAVCGQTEDQKLVVLLDPTETVPEDTAQSFVDRLWSTVEQAFEEEGPAWARQMIQKSHVHVCTPNKPVLRTGGKWNVNRKRTMASYQAVIEAAHGKLFTGLSPKRRL